MCDIKETLKENSYDVVCRASHIKHMVEAYFKNYSLGDVKIPRIRLGYKLKDDDERDLELYFRAEISLDILASFKYPEHYKDIEKRIEKDKEICDDCSIHYTEKVTFMDSIHTKTHRYNTFEFDEKTSDIDIAKKMVEDIKYEISKHCNEVLEDAGFSYYYYGYE